jgi:hypothetical protein
MDRTNIGHMIVAGLIAGLWTNAWEYVLNDLVLSAEYMIVPGDQVWFEFAVPD